MFGFAFNWIILRSSLAALDDKFKDQNNETTFDSWYNDKLGRVKANRISQELMDDAREKATSMNFEQTRLLLESYHRCKGKSIKFFKTNLVSNVCLFFQLFCFFQLWLKKKLLIKFGLFWQNTEKLSIISFLTLDINLTAL